MQGPGQASTRKAPDDFSFPGDPRTMSSPIWKTPGRNYLVLGPVMAGWEESYLDRANSGTDGDL